MRQKLARSLPSPGGTDSPAQINPEDQSLRVQRAKFDKAETAYRTISEVSEELSIPQHVLRFWESKFTVIKPIKRGGGRRYYKPDDIQSLKIIQRLLYEQGYTIKGVQRMISERGLKPIDYPVSRVSRSVGQPALPGNSFTQNAAQGNDEKNLSEVDSLKEVLGELKELKNKLNKLFES
ncbi:MAG: MerR family transcriptional regulator [Rhodospirillaceae bacterium]|nr:MerR family transcriptional regulator [Rhodospirillaceae bacterium]